MALNFCSSGALNWHFGVLVIQHLLEASGFIKPQQAILTFPQHISIEMCPHATDLHLQMTSSLFRLVLNMRKGYINEE